MLWWKQLEQCRWKVTCKVRERTQDLVLAAETVDRTRRLHKTVWRAKCILIVARCQEPRSLWSGGYIFIRWKVSVLAPHMRRTRTHLEASEMRIGPSGKNDLKHSWRKLDRIQEKSADSESADAAPIGEKGPFRLPKGSFYDPPMASRRWRWELINTSMQTLKCWKMKNHGYSVA